MVQYLLPFALVFSLSVVQFLSSRVNIEQSKYRQQIVSFAAAIALTYLLFSLFPKTYDHSDGMNMTLYIPLIGGFALIYLLEKSFFRKFSERFSLRNLKSFHDEIHVVVLFIYHFVIGSVLLQVLEEDLSAGLLFLPPLVMFTTIGNWSLHHKYLEQIPLRRTLLASSTILGALFSRFILSNESFAGTLERFLLKYIGAAPDVLNFMHTLEMVLLNFVAGVFLFMVVREALPRPKEGDPLFFIAGLVFYGALISIAGALLG